jgi:ADP-heptose:LPS heptosyltransferase
LAIAGGLVDLARPIEARPLAGFFARDGELPGELAAYFSEFDLILSYLYDPDGIFRSNVARCTPAQFIAGPHRAESTTGLHATQVYLKPLERLAIYDADSIPKLSIGPAGTPLFATPTLEADDPATPPIVLALHPGSGSEKKNWPEERWAELLEELEQQTALRLLLVGGEAEGERLQRLAAALPPLRTRVAQSLPLAELAGWLAGCHGFIGHDSGISHLAAALGLPGLLLWGETEASLWRPPSQRMRLLRSPGGLNRLPVDQVLAETSKMWPSGFIFQS